MKNETIKRNLIAVFLLSTIFFNLIVGAAAQSSGGTYTITKAVISSGGAGNAQQSTGGTFAVAGTIGQAVAGDALTGGSFALNSGFWSPTVYNVGVEGDLRDRPAGTGTVGPNDIVQAQLFINGTASIDPEYNEFQRADTAPRATFGDGVIGPTDIVQTIRYLNGTDAKHDAAGPTEKIAAPRTAETPTENKSAANPLFLPREVRVESTATTAGQQVTVNIRVDAVGDEAAYGFIINYDKTKLTNPVIGAGNAGAATRACNVNWASGINCYVGAFPNDRAGSTDSQIGEIGAGNNQILITVRFNVAANASGSLPLTLSNVEISNDNADSVPVSSANGTVTVTGTTAANVAIGGRVMTTDGRGIRNAVVTMTDEAGNLRTTISTAFGYFRFDDAAAGATYIFTVKSKRFTFAASSQTRAVNEDVTDLLFVANP